MIDYKNIYRTKSNEYDILVSREDYKGNILPAIESIIKLEGLDIIELGAGTGRLTTKLAPKSNSIRAYDESVHMLDLARKKLTKLNLDNWLIGIADNRDIPMNDNSTDLVISGWSISSIVIYNEEKWKREIDKCIYEIKRVLRNKGTIIILETLGTGQTEPKPPADILSEFYSYIEKMYNFSKKWIRTDYKFKTLEEAVTLIGFFFGETLANEVKNNKTLIVPECTGIWWLTI